MEEQLILYTYVDDKNSLPFPSESEQVVISDFRADYKRMSSAPIITCTVMHTLCLDDLWNYKVYATFNGEKFFIKQIPSSSFSNTDARYKHDVELISERSILDNVYFYDVVDSSSDEDKPVSNNSNFTFFGDIKEFVSRLNESLSYSKVGYNVELDEGIESEVKQVVFKDQFFSNVLQEIYNTYNLPYYFQGKTIHIGYNSIDIDHVFKYGIDESLLSIEKQNANNKVINRITGIGSQDNIPYYYPNFDEKGEVGVYYNGKLDIAVVSNTARFRKIKLSDTFTYRSATNIVTDLIDYSKPNIKSVKEEYSSNGEKEWVIMYDYLLGLNAPETIQINIQFYYRYLNRFYVHVINQSSGKIISKINKNLSTYNIYLQGGEHTIEVVARIQDEIYNGYYDDDDNPLDFDKIDINYIDCVIYNDMYMSASYTKIGEDSWYLNGVKTLLSDYGLSVSRRPADGDKITVKQISYINPQPNLMPPIYRNTNGSERFYNAVNDTYINPSTNIPYVFENEYEDGSPKEYIATFEDVKPTIKGMTNVDGVRIDSFLEFAYDLNDNDEFDSNGEYLHPYFFAKLPKLNGAHGFNLFDHAIDESEMVIAMTSGTCGSCEFVIGVDSNTQKNLVQVDNYGRLLRDVDGDVRCGRVGKPKELPLDHQNDTIKNEVWIALRKDINTFGVILPNVTNNYKPKVEDTFVILHIDLPSSYITSAEERLKEEIIKYMAENNKEKFKFSISFSRIFFAEHPEILEQLDENSKITIEYDKKEYEMYVSSYSYSMASDKPLPEIKVELSETLKVEQTALQNVVSEIKKENTGAIANISYFEKELINIKQLLLNMPSQGTTTNSGALLKEIITNSPSVGFISTGTKLQAGMTFEEIFQKIFFRLEKATLTGSISTANDVEYGTEKGYLTYTTNRNANGKMLEAYYDGSSTNKLEFSKEENGIQTAERTLSGNYTSKETYTAVVVFDASEDGSIPQTTLTNTISVNVKRKWFAGAVTSIPTTSEQVRALGSSGLYNGKGTYKFYAQPFLKLAICIPTDTIYEITLTKYPGNFIEDKGAYVGPINISVEGANGSAAQTYKMWVIQGATTHDADTFTFKTS